jgi:hypothetical protein
MNTLDDDLIRAVCSALNELTADISDSPPRLTSAGVATVVAVPPHRDRRRMLVLAAAMIALATSVAALAAIRRDGRAVRPTDSSPSTAPLTTSSSSPSVAHPIPASTSLSTNTSTANTTVSLGDVPYLAVGESVMLGAKPVLEALGIKTVAQISKGTPGEIEQLRQERAKNRISQGVVIQLGTNGAVTRQEYESVLAEVSDIKLVVVMTVNAPKPWIAGNNEIIRSLPQTHPNVVVLDWETRSVEVADHIASDGTHLKDDISKQFYANLILKALGLAVPPATLPDRAIDLYTHCGINGVMIDGVWWEASPVLSGGSANPPTGWGNPYQKGVLHFNDSATATFTGTSEAGDTLVASFHRTSSTEFPLICS